MSLEKELNTETNMSCDEGYEKDPLVELADTVYEKGYNEGFNSGAFSLSLAAFMASGLLIVYDAVKAKFKK